MAYFLPIKGVGVDLEDIRRFKGLGRKKNKFFLKKIFTDSEIKYCFSKGEPAPHLAARFCGKEAVIKAAAGLLERKLLPGEIEILNNKAGKPQVRIANKEAGDIMFFLSLSHDKNKAIAFAIAVGNN